MLSGKCRPSCLGLNILSHGYALILLYFFLYFQLSGHLRTNSFSLEGTNVNYYEDEDDEEDDEDFIPDGELRWKWIVHVWRKLLVICD